MVASSMKKKYLQTLMALALLGILGGVMIYLDRRGNREAAKIESKPTEKVVALDSNQIQAFTIRPRAGVAITCQRTDGSWSLVEPRKLAADASAVSSLLSSLTSATLDEVITDRPQQLKDFGLDPPATAIEVSASGKPEKTALLLGDDTPTSSAVYAQVAGNPRVFTLPSSLKSSLLKTIFDLRDRRAVALEVDQLQRLQVKSKDKGFTLAKNTQGVWELVLPPAVRTDRFAAEDIVSRLRNLSMQTVAAEDKKKPGEYGFGAPSLRIELQAPSGSQTLVLGKQDKEGNRYFATNSTLEPVFTLPADFLTSFQKDAADLRSKDLFSFSMFDVNRLEVDTPAGHRVFERQNNKWKQTAPSPKDEPTEKVESFLNRLRDLRATAFPKGENLAAFGLAKPAYRFKAQFGDKNETEIVEAARAGERAYARRSTDLVACEVTKTSLDDVEKALGEL
jgi:hypothetical protein